MASPRALAALLPFMVVVACTGGAGPVSTAGDGASGSSDAPAEPGADPAADAPASPGRSDPQGPTILSLATDRTSLGEGGSLTVIAVVSDPDGAGDLVGGNLTSPDGAATYAAFAPTGAKGGFSAKVTWAMVNDTLPISFTSASSSRTFLAEFFDTVGHRATKTVKVALDCSAKGGSACSGACTDLQRSAKHCGSCGKDCAGGQCVDGVCVMIARDLVTNATPVTPKSCAERCAGPGGYACESSCKFATFKSSSKWEPGFVDLSGTDAVAMRYGYFDVVTQQGCSTVPPAKLGGQDAAEQLCCCVRR